MGHIAHLRNQFKSMNRAEQSYYYIYHEIGPVDFQISRMYFCNFVFISLWKKAWLFNLNKLKSSSTKHACFLSSLVEIGPPVQEKNIFFYLSMYFRYFISSPIGQGQDPFICTNLNSLTQECFVPSLVEIGPVVLKKMKMWKGYRQTDENLTSAFSSGELKPVKII